VYLLEKESRTPSWQTRPPPECLKGRALGAQPGTGSQPPTVTCQPPDCDMPAPYCDAHHKGGKGGTGGK